MLWQVICSLEGKTFNIFTYFEKRGMKMETTNYEQAIPSEIPIISESPHPSSSTTASSARSTL
jgi:hypothetical protein